MPSYRTAPTTEDLTGVYWARVVSPPVPPNLVATWQVNRGAAIPVVGMQTLRAREVALQSNKLEQGALDRLLDTLGWLGNRPKDVPIKTANTQMIRLPFSLTATGSFTFEYSQDDSEPYPDALSFGTLSDSNGRTILGDSDKPTYNMGGDSVLVSIPVPTVAAANLLALENDAASGRSIRIRRIIIEPDNAAQTTANFVQLNIQRYFNVATSGGSLGTTPIPFDKTNDPAFGGLVRVAGSGAGFTASGFEGSGGLDSFNIWVPAAAATAVNGPIYSREYTLVGAKPLIIPPGAGNGICFRGNGTTGVATNLTAGPGATGFWGVRVIFTWEK